MREMTVPAQPESIPVVTDFVNAELEQLGCNSKIRASIDVAVDELFANISHYAYHPDTGPATVQVEVEEEPLAVIITFLDDGRPFNPLDMEAPDTALPAKARKIGGLGIYIVRKTMDAITYEYRDGKNILRIRKNLEGRAE